MNRTVGSITQADILRDLHEAYNIPAVSDSEFTTKMYATANGCTYDEARGIIKRALRQKAIERVGWRLCAISNYKSIAYKVVKKPLTTEPD